MIEVKKYLELTEETRNFLLDFIDAEFGHISFVNEIEWAEPSWTVVYYEDNKIASFYNIVERIISIDQIEVRVAGINNVITPKEFRGKGYSSKILREAERLIFTDLKCEMGLLLCADDLVPFYTRLNWYKIECLLHFDQSNGERLWEASAMLLSQEDRVLPNQIKLNGLPW